MIKGFSEKMSLRSLLNIFYCIFTGSHISVTFFMPYVICISSELTIYLKSAPLAAMLSCMASWCLTTTPGPIRYGYNTTLWTANNDISTFLLKTKRKLTDAVKLHYLPRRKTRLDKKRKYFYISICIEGKWIFIIEKNAYLIRIDDDLALLLVTARDKKHVVERWRVVQYGVIVEGGEDVPCTELE